MEINKKVLKISVEPIIKRRWLTKLIVGNNRSTRSLVKTLIFFRVINQSEFDAEDLHLNCIKIETETREGYSYNSGLIVIIPQLKAHAAFKTKHFMARLPHEGSYWIQTDLSTSSPYEIETCQVHPGKSLGKGWHGAGPKNIWIDLISVIDTVTIKLYIVNFILLFCSLVLLLFTFELIKVTRLLAK